MGHSEAVPESHPNSPPIPPHALDARGMLPSGHAEAATIAAHELNCFLAMLGQLSPEDWTVPMVYSRWDVRQIMADVVGATAYAQWAEFARQRSLQLVDLRRRSRLASNRPPHWSSAMDHQRFDLLARAVSTCCSRREALGILMAGALFGLGADRARAAQDATPEAACPDGLTSCAEPGECVDLQTDLANCGACGSICESALVGVACRNGECVRASCPEGIEYCGAVDGCRDLSVDPAHCGACGNVCPSGVCIEGVCSPDASDCAAGQTNCGGVCVNTCCDNDNCGACGNVCAAGETCFEGQCGCPSGLCGPTTPPSTGVGGAPLPTWVVMAGASALAAMVAYWQRAGGRLLSGDEESDG